MKPTTNWFQTLVRLIANGAVYQRGVELRWKAKPDARSAVLANAGTVLHRVRMADARTHGLVMGQFVPHPGHCPLPVACSPVTPTETLDLDASDAC